MSTLADYRYLWDGSAPAWVIAQMNGKPLFPFNTVTGQAFGILDGEPQLMEQILQRMQSAGRPWLDYVEWHVQRSTLEDVFNRIEAISKRVWRIRTRTSRELGAQALQIAAPLEDVQTQLRIPQERTSLLQAARTVWAVHLKLLELERLHHL